MKNTYLYHFIFQPDSIESILLF